MEPEIGLENLPQTVLDNLLQYLPDSSMAAISGLSMVANRGLSQLTSSSNFFWLSRLDDMFGVEASATVVDKESLHHDIDVEHAYKNILLIEDETEDKYVWETDIDTATVWFLYKNLVGAEYYGILNKAAFNGYYELVQLVMLKLAPKHSDTSNYAKQLEKGIIDASSGENYLEKTFKMSHAKTIDILFKYLRRKPRAIKTYGKLIYKALLKTAKAPFDHPDIAEELLRWAGELDIDASKYKNEMDVVFNTACKHGHIDLVTVLIKHKVKAGNDALKDACRGGYMRVYKLLISLGLVPNHKTLKQACIGGNVGIVNSILDSGVDPVNNSNTYLTAAVEANHLDVVKLLVARGVDPLDYNFYIINSIQGDGDVYKPMLKLLLSYLDPLPKIRKEIVDRINSYIITIDYEDHSGHVLIIEPIVRYLIKRGIPLNQEMLNTSLYHAVAVNNISAIKLLLKYGADPSTNNCAVVGIASQATATTKILVDAIRGN